MNTLSVSTTNHGDQIGIFTKGLLASSPAGSYTVTARIESIPRITEEIDIGREAVDSSGLQGAAVVLFEEDVVQRSALVGSDDGDLLDLSDGEGLGEEYKSNIEGSAEVQGGGEVVPLQVVPLASIGGPAVLAVGAPVVVSKEKGNQGSNSRWISVMRRAHERKWENKGHTSCRGARWREPRSRSER